MATSDLLQRDFEIPAQDGYALAATRFGEGDRVIVVNSATAVPRRIYRHFAEHAAGLGYTVITYDYRGIGGSKPESLRGFECRARDWVFEDMSGVLEWVSETLSPKQVFMVSHSIGGQLAGMLPDSSLVDAMVTLSSQSGYWRLQGAEQKALVALHMHLTFPTLVALFGYMPWSKFGGEDLPGGVAKEWASWCRTPRYLLDDDSLPLERFQDFDAPVLAYSFEDDKWGTKASVDALMLSTYPNVERRHVSPADKGLRSLGHFGVFRPDAKVLWEEMIDWLEKPAASNAA